jgi:hypothetical protein
LLVHGKKGLELEKQRVANISKVRTVVHVKSDAETVQLAEKYEEFGESLIGSRVSVVEQNELDDMEEVSEGDEDSEGEKDE